jgi:hypothetical protein
MPRVGSTRPQLREPRHQILVIVIMRVIVRVRVRGDLVYGDLATETACPRDQMDHPGILC